MAPSSDDLTAGRPVEATVPPAAEGPSAVAPSAVAPSPSGIGTGLVLLLAVACALSVANLYYAQPLLDTIATDLGTSAGTAGLIVTASQIGYAVGLALIVPLGDLLDRRRLVPVVLLLTAVALAGSAVVPGVGGLVALASLVGLGSVAAQLLVPLAAGLARDDQRGAVVGKVMSGLLLGILLARTVSGLIAEVAGWRAVYWTATVVAAALALVLARALPADGSRPRLRYRSLLRATVVLMATEALLRRRALLGALSFASFSAFWTSIAFLLSEAPFDYGDGVIGLFGLIGAAGALSAVYAGRLADRGRSSGATAAFAAMILGSFAILWFGRAELVALVVGIVLLDLGVQGMQVTNQSLIYALAPDARSRITSAYMVSYFVGGAIGSAVGGWLYSTHGWAGVCTLGAGLGASALVVGFPRRPRRSGEALSPPTV